MRFFFYIYSAVKTHIKNTFFLKMMSVRDIVDGGYGITQPLLFFLTEENPALAHDLMAVAANIIANKGWSEKLFDNDANKLESRIKFSNAAGSNKNGEIPSLVLAYYGFDKAIIGTVTGDPWAGNDDVVRTKRYPDILTNWLGLPGVGAKKVRATLDRQCAEFGHPIEIQINIMATPTKTGDALVADLVKSAGFFYKDGEPLMHYLSRRLQLNISCPNTQHAGVMDARNEILKTLAPQLQALSDIVPEIDLKLSPDMTYEDARELVGVSLEFPFVKSYTIFNTTTRREPFVPVPQYQKVGGASGIGVAKYFLKKQLEIVHILEDLDPEKKITLTVCGGIGSVDIMRERVDAGDGRVVEVSGYTDHMKSSHLIRQLRVAAHKHYPI